MLNYDPARAARSAARRRARRGAVDGDHEPVVDGGETLDDDRCNLRKQNIGKPFQPGDLQVCYVACEEDDDSRTGSIGYQQLVDQKEPLAWRIQIRKGISSGGNGVTTLVDVVFDPAEISG